MAPAWVYEQAECRVASRPGAGGEPAADDHEALSRLLLRAMAGIPLRGALALDVGTGRGRLAFVLAARASRVVGADRDAAAVAAARAEAAARGLGHVTFVEADVEAEATDYRALAGGAPDVVAAHLCLSDAILAKAARALAPGGLVAVAGFHADQWRETGVRSRFAYDERGLEAALEAAGLEARFLGVERTVLDFGDDPMAPRDYLAATGLAERFAASGRLEGFEAYLASGGRRLTTQARVVAVAAPRARNR
ncbi:MAG TPA: methyltransferase domain-containing protein [Thermodesulfobacteriota bacterium]